MVWKSWRVRQRERIVNKWHRKQAGREAVGEPDTVSGSILGGSDEEPTGQALPEAGRPAESTSSQFDSHDTSARGEVKFIPGRHGGDSKLQFSQPRIHKQFQRCHGPNAQRRVSGSGT
jgi:hypothetical protein